jgi:tubulin-specific chaperone C
VSRTRFTEYPSRKASQPSPARVAHDLAPDLHSPIRHSKQNIPDPHRPRRRQDRLNAIEEARKAEADARRAELDAAADPRENIRSFLATFETQKARVERAVDGHRTAVGTPDATPPDELRAALDALQTDIIAMERSVAEASYFLPPYDSRACTAAVDALKKTVADATGTLLPRKKFSFSKKKKESATTETKPEEKETKGEDVAAQLARMGITTDGEGEGPGLRNVTGETIVVDGAALASASGSGDYELKHLTDCEVFLCNITPLRAIRVHDLKNTKVYAGPVAGSVLMHGLSGCTLHLCARQVRVHDAGNGTSFYVRTASGPIIEHSTDVAFAPYAFVYPGSDKVMEEAGFGGTDPGRWAEVEDFGWIKQMQSPNWKIIPEDERVAPPKPPAVI